MVLSLKFHLGVSSLLPIFANHLRLVLPSFSSSLINRTLPYGVLKAASAVPGGQNGVASLEIFPGNRVTIVFVQCSDG